MTKGDENPRVDSDARDARYQRLSPDGVKRRTVSDGESLGVSGALRRKLGWPEDGGPKQSGSPHVRCGEPLWLG